MSLESSAGSPNKLNREQRDLRDAGVTDEVGFGDTAARNHSSKRCGNVLCVMKGKKRHLPRLPSSWAMYAAERQSAISRTTCLSTAIAMHSSGLGHTL